MNKDVIRTKGDVLDIVLITFGLYLFISFLLSLSSIILVVSLASETHLFDNPTVRSSVCYSGFLLAASGVLLFGRAFLLRILTKTELDTDISILAGPLRLRHLRTCAIQILGLYFLLESTSGGVGQFVLAISMESASLWVKFIEHMIGAVLAVLTMCWSDRLSRLFEQRGD